MSPSSSPDPATRDVRVMSAPRLGDLTGMCCLDARKAAAITVLVNGGTVQDSAEAAGVDRRTISRWHQDPRFLEALAAHRRELVVVRRVLVDLLDDPRTEARHKVRLLELLTDPARRIGQGDVGDRQLVVDLVKTGKTRQKRLRRTGSDGMSKAVLRYQQRRAGPHAQEAAQDRPGAIEGDPDVP